MNVRIPGLIVLAALAGAAACKDNPTAAGSGTPAKVISNFQSVNLRGIGATGTVTSEIVDSRLTPLPGTITFSTCDPTIATVAIDPTYQPVPNTSTRAVVTSTSLNKTCIIASASGLKPDTVTAIVLPLTFPGSLSRSTAKIGDTVVINSTTLLKFIPGTTAITVNTAASPPTVLSVTANAITFLAPNIAKADSIHISGVNVTYAGVSLNLGTTTLIHTSADFWGPADTSYATAPDISSILPPDTLTTTHLIAAQPTAANGATQCPEVVQGFGSTGPCAIFKFTLAAPTALSFNTDWDGVDGGNPDIDIYTCSNNNPATCDFEDGGAGATGKKPQATKIFTFPAGTHYFVVELFAACDNSPGCSGNPPTNLIVTIGRTQQ